MESIDAVARGSANYAHSRLDKINGQIDGVHQEIAKLREERSEGDEKVRSEVHRLREDIAGLRPWIKVGSAAALALVGSVVAFVVDQIVGG